ncbi:hypothetical protein FRB94_005707 [Tulasnella sp. JGI-2019a]|nr:hypothetical protein FRB94_005707 [Tulasnella sp. JGI-2019a]
MAHMAQVDVAGHHTAVGATNWAAVDIPIMAPIVGAPTRTTRTASLGINASAAISIHSRVHPID